MPIPSAGELAEGSSMDSDIARRLQDLNKRLEELTSSL